MFVVHHRPHYNNRSRAEVARTAKFIFRLQTGSGLLKETALPQSLARLSVAKPVSASAEYATLAGPARFARPTFSLTTKAGESRQFTVGIQARSTQYAATDRPPPPEERLIP